MEIRYTRALDELYLHGWIKHPKLAPFVPCDTEEEQKMFCRHWMFFALKKAGITLVVQDRVIGMGMLILMPYEKVKHHALVQILIDPDWTHKGYGGELLKNLVHLAKAYLHIEVLYIELIGPTPYLSFFEKRGFTLYATQKDYVEGPKPDRLLLERILL